MTTHKPTVYKPAAHKPAKEALKEAPKEVASGAYKALHNLPVHVTDVHDEKLADGSTGTLIGMLTEEGAKIVAEVLLKAGWKPPHG